MRTQLLCASAVAVIQTTRRLSANCDPGFSATGELHVLPSLRKQSAGISLASPEPPRDRGLDESRQGQLAASQLSGAHVSSGRQQQQISLFLLQSIPARTAAGGPSSASFLDRQPEERLRIHKHVAPAINPGQGAGIGNSVHASHTRADLRSQINTLLLRDGHATRYVCCAFCILVVHRDVLPVAEFPVSRHRNLQATAYPHPRGRLDLRTKLTCMFFRRRIQERFLHSLDAHSSNWPSAVQSHALALLRSGEVSTFPALIRRVLEDVRRDTAAATAASASSNNPTANNTQTSSSSTNASESNPTKDGVNGAPVVNGTNRTASGVNGTSAGADGTTNLAIPTAVVEAVLKVVKDSLETVCEVEPDGSAGG